VIIIPGGFPPGFLTLISVAMKKKIVRVFMNIMSRKQNHINDNSSQNSSQEDYNSYYFEIVKMEYEHENARRISLENRANMLLVFIGATIAFSSRYCSISSIRSAWNRNDVLGIANVVLLCAYIWCLLICIVMLWKVIAPLKNYTYDLTKLQTDGTLTDFPKNKYFRIIKNLIQYTEKTKHLNNKKAHCFTRANQYFLGYLITSVIIIILNA
jgi:uncharacterized membrane protein YcjF (UPF0283 family)